jgi:hypothetical protein
MVRNVGKILAVSLLFLFLSCSAPPTYSRKNISQTIVAIAEKEFKLKVKAVSVGNTIWIYLPFKSALFIEKSWGKEISEAKREICLVLGRAALSMKEPPEFYCLLVSDIDAEGRDSYTIGRISDLVKFNLFFISSDDITKRTAFFSFPNPEAIGDATGRHMYPYDIQPEEFRGYLSRQNPD